MTPLLEIALLVLASLSVWIVVALIVYPVLLRCGVKSDRAYFWAMIWFISPMMVPIVAFFWLFDRYATWVQRRCGK